MDIRVENHGSIVLLRALTSRGDTWLYENLDPEGLEFGASKVVEPRYVADIIIGALNDGLEVA